MTIESIKNILASSLLFPVLLVAPLAAPSAANHADGADPGEGGKLHRENCIGCHRSLTRGDADSLYTRKDRRVTSLSGLRAQVDRCQFALELQWFDEEIDHVTEYLNRKFYRF